MIKKAFISLILCIIPLSTYALDFNIGQGSTDITLELALKDTEGNDLGLPIKVIWQDEERKKTYAIVNFLENNLVSISKKIPQNEVNGYLLFDTSNTAKAQNRDVLDQRYSIKVNYNFGGSSSNKSELFYVILDRAEEGYKIVDFYSQSDKASEEEEIINSSQVVISGKVEGSFYSRRDISVGLYNKRGEVLYLAYTDRDGLYEINLTDFEDTLDLDTEYYLIYGKIGDVDEDEIGYLYDSITYSFKSYINIVDRFKEPVNLTVVPNLKDQVVKEPFPFIFLIICSLLYGTFMYKYVIKKLIKKMFIHPFRKTNHVIYNKRKDLVNNLIKNNLGKNF